MKSGPDRAPARAMLYATGLDEADIRKPLVAVVHTWSNVSPCNLNLRDLAQARRRRRARRGRHADRIQHDRGHRRHRDGHAGHARLAGQPRSHHRFDRTRRRRPFARRDGRAVRLRQDDSRRRDGAGAARHSRRRAVRRQHRARQARRKIDHDPAGVRSGRRARRGQDRRCATCARSNTRRVPARAHAAASSPRTRWR